MKNIKNLEEFLNEGSSSAFDSKYWADYNVDTSGQGPKGFSEKSKDFQDTFEEALTDWQSDADETLNSSEIKKIYDLAQEFFKKERWISVNVIQAMIAQEA